MRLINALYKIHGYLVGKINASVDYVIDNWHIEIKKK